MKVRLRSGVVFWLAVLLLLGLWKVEGVVLEKSVLLEDQHVDQQQVLYFEYSPTEDAVLFSSFILLFISNFLSFSFSSLIPLIPLID